MKYTASNSRTNEVEVIVKTNDLDMALHSFAAACESDSPFNHANVIDNDTDEVIALMDDATETLYLSDEVQEYMAEVVAMGMLAEILGAVLGEPSAPLALPEGLPC